MTQRNLAFLCGAVALTLFGAINALAQPVHRATK